MLALEFTFKPDSQSAKLLFPGEIHVALFQEFARVSNSKYEKV